MGATGGAAAGPGVTSQFLGGAGAGGALPSPTATSPFLGVGAGGGLFGAAATAGVAAAAGVGVHGVTTIPENLTSQPKDSMAGMQAGASKTFDVISRTWVAQVIRPGGTPRSLSPMVEKISNSLGFIYLATTRGGLCVGGTKGSGFAMVRLATGKWSAPCALKVVGLSAGITIGYERLKTFVFLQDPEDVASLVAGEDDTELDANLHLRVGSMGVTLGSGQTVNLGDSQARQSPKNVAYGVSKGLIADLSLGGLKIRHNHLLNSLTYGSGPAITPATILSGAVPAPAFSNQLVGQIDSFLMHAKRQYAA